MARIYLDSSAVVTRYSKEEGTSAVRALFRGAHLGRTTLCASEWNVGEVLGVLQRKARKSGQLKDFVRQRARMHAEVSTLTRLGFLDLVPVTSQLLRESWVVLEKRLLYAADALQIATARGRDCDHFVTGDADLHDAAVHEGLMSHHLASHQAAIRELAE